MHPAYSGLWESVSPSKDTRDARFMRRALDLALLGWGQTAPNPMVGAVVVRDGHIVGEGHHARFGGDHAEVVALGAAGESARGGTLYVTLEPCNHHGKTPPCGDAIIAAGIARVVAAIPDPNPEAAGGAAKLRAAGVTVEFGVEEKAASEMNAAFLFAAAADRPWNVLKLALSSEGAVADAGRSNRWLTGEASRREVHRLRANFDAIAVGAGTVVADNPKLSARGAVAPRVAPARVIFDRHAVTPVTSRLVRTAGKLPTILVASPDADASAIEKRGVRIIRAAKNVDALRTLREEGIRSMLVEGGAALARSLLQDNLIDRLIIFQTRITLGPRALKPFSSAAEFGFMREISSARFGEDEMTVYALPEDSVHRNS